MPGLPPPAPASRADRPDTAAVGVGEAREEEHEAASSKAAQKVATGPSDEQLKKSEENSKARDEKEGEPSADQVSKKKTKKASADSDGESKPRKSPKEDSEGIKKKKKKKKKAEASGEKSAEQSDVESGVMHNDVDETTAAADATSSWGFGFFGNSEGNDASKKDATEKEASPSAPRPSLLGLIVGADPVEEAPKGNEVPPLKLSTVDGADDQSDSSSSEDGETDGGITSTIAGFFWGI
ncbi:uncharacterized protein EMH_0002430 [Eimeria mitis]|uniref:Uncharacterized protein n=1 Tax=Eimeria mitis TaxID=44415 RepID=U6JU05_9EIME|nr:uncharacterized protein EMH_0002430 [Eimeria mitis]CDJ28869.1 hypothetical protein EMH_0002430 [Eimeria mitis]